MARDDQPLYALPCPLPAREAVHQLGALGPAARAQSLHRSVTEVEIALGDDPFAPALGLTVEERPSGSYVTAHSVRSAFLRDFMRVVKAGVSLIAIVGIIASCTRLPRSELGPVLAGIGVGWAALYGLVTVLHELIEETHAASAGDARLRQHISDLLVRRR